jgi:hypothetical protein
MQFFGFYMNSQAISNVNTYRDVNDPLNSALIKF